MFQCLHIWARNLQPELLSSLRPRRGAKYCDERVCMSVCLSVCPLAYLKNHTSKPHEIFCPCFRDRGSVVLWPQCFLIMGPYGAWRWQYRLEDCSGHQAVINFQRIPQVAPHCLTLSSYTTAANGASGSSLKPGRPGPGKPGSIGLKCRPVRPRSDGLGRAAF